MTKIAYIGLELGGLTSTFIHREVRALRERGVDVTTYSIHSPRDEVVSEESREIATATRYLYDAPKREVARAMLKMAAHRPVELARTLGMAARDAVRAEVTERSDRPKVLAHFVFGTLLASWLEEGNVDHVHAHFANVSTPIAMYASTLIGVPFSFTCHANDIFERGVALKEKVARSKFTACISRFNVDYLADRGCDEDRMVVVRCGLDLSDFGYRDPDASADGFHVVGVGRLVEKKGFSHLIDAVAELRRRGRSVSCTIVGGGPLHDALSKRIADGDLRAHVRLLGSQPQERVREIVGTADAFALPCVVTSAGDVDGIPVSLMEAMAAGVPVVSTAVSGIPELVVHRENGLLAQPGDDTALADSIDTLIADPAMARRLARAARRTIEDEFDQRENAQRLERLFVRAA